MKRRGRLFTLMLALILLLAAGGALVLIDQTSAAAPDRHTFLHINCRHHAHGEAWHDGHARALLAGRAARDRARAAARFEGRDLELAPATASEKGLAQRDKN